MAPKISVLGLSTRGRGGDFVVEEAESAGTFDDLRLTTEQLYSENALSNSEMLALCGVYGALQEGAEVQYVNLADRLPEAETASAEHAELVRGLLDESDGFVFCTPVYFGDRSSYLNTFFNLASSLEENPLDGKVVGVSSVGAKRNGGQETTNIYSLYDAATLGALCVGNGPPTSQYGGTGWGGDLGTVINDDFGLNTARGTGRRVAEVAEIVGMSRDGSRSELLLISTSGGSDESLDTVEEVLEENGDVDIETLRLSDFEVKRCIGCRSCPNGRDDFRCVVRDDMMEIEGKLASADALVVMGSSFSLNSAYQVFMERTRYIRRDDFRLRNKPYFALTCSERRGDIFGMRAMTSFIRHNTVFVGPPSRVSPGSDGVPSLDRFARVASLLKEGNSRVGERDYEYVDVGYDE